MDDERSTCPLSRVQSEVSLWTFFSLSLLSDRFSSVSSDQQHTQRSQAAKKVLASPVLQWNFYPYRSFENSCSLRGWLIMRAFCAILLWRVDAFQHSILGKMDLNMIWSLKHGFHPPFPCWRHMWKLVLLMFAWGLVEGSGLSVMFVEDELSGFCLRWSMLSSYRCSACTGIGCFGGCFWVMHLATDRRINMIWRGSSKIADLPGDKRWN